MIQTNEKERTSMDEHLGDPLQETLRERIDRQLHSTGSHFKRVQRRCNFGLTNAEWNALSHEQREALVKCDRALEPRRVRVR